MHQDFVPVSDAADGQQLANVMASKELGLSESTDLKALVDNCGATVLTATIENAPLRDLFSTRLAPTVGELPAQVAESLFVKAVSLSEAEQQNAVQEDLSAEPS